MPERVGLIAKLQFIGGAAITGIKQASSAFSRMGKHANLVGKGVGNIRAGFGGMTIAGLGLAGAVTKTIKDFGDFEFQMAKAGSLTKATGQDFSKLESLAKKMGAETFFTATQAAEAMQVLGRAGFDAEKTMKVLPTVMNLAAAENLTLAEAATYTTKTMNAFRLQASDADRVADTLALTSLSTATDVRQLGEGMRYAGTTAGMLGVPMEQTVFTMGLLADVARDSSTAGTALNNTMIKLSANQKKGFVTVGKYRVAIEKTAKGGVDLNSTMLNLVTALKQIEDPLERDKALTQLLGVRGKVTAGAVGAMEKKLREFFPTTENAEVALAAFNKRAKGSAENLRKVQEATALGQWKKFTSALSKVSVTIGGMLAGKLLPMMEKATAFIGDVGTALEYLGKKGPEATAKLSGVGSKAIDVARGLKEGFAAAGDVFKTVGEVIKTVGSALGVNFGKGQLSDIIRIGMKTTAWLVSLKLATSILGRMAKVAKGSFQIVRGVLGSLGTATKGVVGLLSTKFPKLAKMLPAGMKRLTGAVTAAEKITAQPVRVVNFDEAGGMLGPGASLGTSGGGAKEGATKALRALGRGARGLGGRLAGIAKSGVGLIKTFGVGKMGLVGAAGALGFAFGTLLDRTFGLSDKISTAAMSVDRERFATMERIKIQRGAMIQSTRQTASLIRNFERMSKAGVTVEGPGGTRQAVTRALVTRLVQQRIKGEPEAQRRAILAAVKPLLDKIPDKPPSVNLKVNLDGREILRGTKKAEGESEHRKGKQKPAGTKLRERAM